jgi:hypothetical protein
MPVMVDSSWLNTKVNQTKIESIARSSSAHSRVHGDLLPTGSRRVYFDCKGNKGQMGSRFEEHFTVDNRRPFTIENLGE